MWDKYNQQEIGLSSPEISFSIDKIEGTLSNLVVLSTLIVSIDRKDENALKFSTYPNPFSGQTQISYFIPSDTHVVLTISDSFGKEIKRFADDRQRDGQYNYTFEARAIAPGIYFCTLRTNDFVETKKLILMND